MLCFNSLDNTYRLVTVQQKLCQLNNTREHRVTRLKVRESSAVSNVYNYSFGVHRNLMIKTSDHTDKLLCTEATFC